MRILRATIPNIKAAAKAIQEGKLVIMPTETVYGIACDACNVDAVRKVYEVKERPAENPLIVHISSLDQIEEIVSEFPDSAQRLADRFWPGPLTLVLPKNDRVPPEVTAGLNSVAVRMPAHPVALSLIRHAGRPVAAPSANIFMQLSPTRIDHLDPRLADLVEIALDGGPAKVGVESTVVDCTGDGVRVLRPGGISRSDLQAALGAPLISAPPGGPRRSPGMYARHYAPHARVELVDKVPAGKPGLTFDAASDAQIKMPEDARAYGASLYDALHRLDRQGPDVIYVQRPPSEPEWEAVLDRLVKASASE